MVASIVGLWYNEAEVSGGMAVGCVIVITSGKGGTGKTSLTGGLGTALALQGHKVLCIDGDVGLRNLDTVSYTHLDVYKRQTAYSRSSQPQ